MQDDYLIEIQLFLNKNCIFVASCSKQRLSRNMPIIFSVKLFNLNTEGGRQGTASIDCKKKKMKIWYYTKAT